MLADALRVQVEEYAAESRTKNPLYLRAAAGTLRTEHIARYLANVHGLVQRTVPNLARASEVAAARGEDALARHFAHKLEEELGHDAWSARDLTRVGGEAPTGRAALLPSMRAYLAYQEKLIDEDPSLYLVYIFFAEYLIVLLGSEWLGLLETRCGVARTNMTVVSNHVELDRDHVQEALDHVDELIGDPSKLPVMREILAALFAHFDRFCEEVCTLESGRDRAPRAAAASVSLA